MTPYTVPGKTSFIPQCPAGQVCDWRSDCPGVKGFSWHNVFISARHKALVTTIANALDGRLNPIRAAGTNTSMLKAIFCERMATCSRAIIDVTDLPPSVMFELGSICTFCSDLLILHKDEMHLPPPLSALTTHPYSDEDELRDKVRNWSVSLVDEERRLVSQMLSSKEKRHAVWYYCKAPETSRRDSPQPLSGGLSGAGVVAEALRQISGTQPSVACTTDAGGDAALDENLYLLDAPIQRDCPNITSQEVESFHRFVFDKVAIDTTAYTLEKCLVEWREKAAGPSYKPIAVTHNHISKKIWDEIQTTVTFEVLSRTEWAERYPRESLGIFFKGPYVPCIAGALDDYGVVIRAPNPRNHTAIVLLMAGLHAPATHAAANAVVDPRELKRLFADQRLGQGPDDELFFEGVFKVKRTYCPPDLGQLEWVHLARLGAPREGSPSSCPPAEGRATPSGPAKRKKGTKGKGKRNWVKMLVDHHWNEKQKGWDPNVDALPFDTFSVERVGIEKSTVSQHFKEEFGGYEVYRDMCVDYQNDHRNEDLVNRLVSLVDRYYPVVSRHFKEKRVASKPKGAKPRQIPSGRTPGQPSRGDDE